MASESDPGTLATAAAVVRFALELAALAVPGYWGFRTGPTTLARVGLGVGIPLAVAAVWGLFGSPGAPYRLDGPGRLALELAILGAATLALFALGRTALGAAFGAVAALDTAALYVL